MRTRFFVVLFLLFFSNFAKNSNADPTPDILSFNPETGTFSAATKIEPNRVYYYVGGAQGDQPYFALSLTPGQLTLEKYLPEGWQEEIQPKGDNWFGQRIAPKKPLQNVQTPTASLMWWPLGADTVLPERFFGLQARKLYKLKPAPLSSYVRTDSAVYGEFSLTDCASSYPGISTDIEARIAYYGKHHWLSDVNGPAECLTGRERNPDSVWVPLRDAETISVRAFDQAGGWMGWEGVPDPKTGEIAWEPMLRLIDRPFDPDYLLRPGYGGPADSTPRLDDIRRSSKTTQAYNEKGGVTELPDFVGSWLEFQTVSKKSVKPGRIYDVYSEEANGWVSHLSLNHSKGAPALKPLAPGTTIPVGYLNSDPRPDERHAGLYQLILNKTEKTEWHLLSRNIVLGKEMAQERVQIIDARTLQTQVYDDRSKTWEIGAGSGETKGKLWARNVPSKFLSASQKDVSGFVGQVFKSPILPNQPGCNYTKELPKTFTYRNLRVAFNSTGWLGNQVAKVVLSNYTYCYFAQDIPSYAGNDGGGAIGERTVIVGGTTLHNGSDGSTLNILVH